uniref:Uncharacterized protein n=1 Tax=Arundo donax TaxID=35708 RepID=A0A0A9HLS7_ARUDO
MHSCSRAVVLPQDVFAGFHDLWFALVDR